MTPTKEQLADPKWWNENAPEGATHWERESSDASAGWMKKDGGEWFFLSSKGCWLKHIVRHVSEERLQNMVPCPDSSPAWTGHALPPVGSVCEACYTSPDEYYQAKVLAHDDGKAVYRWLAGPCVGDICESDNLIFCKISGPHLKFRPLRTPEQIAEEEREKAIEEMWNVYWQPDAPPCLFKNAQIERSCITCHM